MSFLKNWTHDGGELSPDGGRKAKEVGLLERIDALLIPGSPDPVQAFVVYATSKPTGPVPGQTVVLADPAPPACTTCSHG